MRPRPETAGGGWGARGGASGAGGGCARGRRGGGGSGGGGTRMFARASGVSAIEGLVGGGVRLVCRSTAGAEIIRETLKKHLIQGEAVRERHRPPTPLW